MVKLSEIIGIKWIVGYVDSYGKVHHKVVKFGDPMDSHNKLWPSIHHNKWRWVPTNPNHLNTYGETLDDDSIDKIWQIIDWYS